MASQGRRGFPHVAAGVCVLLLVLTAGRLWAGPEDRYPVPEPLVDPGASGAGILEQALGQFYPIGWSADGKLAYLELGNIGGPCGDCPYIVVTVQNLVTDEVLWRWKSDTLDPSDDVVATGWQANGGEIQAELARYAIEPLNPAAGIVMGRGDRLRALGREYTFQVRASTAKTEVPNPYTEGSTTYDLVLDAELFASAPGLGSKRIHRASFDTEDRVVQMGVAGALVSDTSPRAAVVVATVFLDFEHNRTVEWQIVGAHLTYGYQ